MMSYSENIKNLRVSLFMYQQEFGKELGVSKQSVYNYENGLKHPRLRVVRKLLELAKKHKKHYTIEDFLGD